MDTEISISYIFHISQNIIFIFPRLFKIVKTIHTPRTLQKQIGFDPRALSLLTSSQEKKKKEGLFLQEITGGIVDNWTKF